jgi:hypothetical protein
MVPTVTYCSPELEQCNKCYMHRDVVLPARLCFLFNGQDAETEVLEARWPSRSSSQPITGLIPPFGKRIPTPDGHVQLTLPRLLPWSDSPGDMQDLAGPLSCSGWRRTCVECHLCDPESLAGKVHSPSTRFHMWKPGGARQSAP